MTRRFPLYFLVLLTLWSISSLARAEVPNNERIQPWRDNPSYWQYGGRPVMLVGGTKNDNLFQIDDLETHLDALRAAGGNYVRNTMSSRDKGDLWPFAKRDDGKYDLAKLSDAYFEKMEKLLKLSQERDIIIQIELWDRFDFAGQPWQLNPYRPANNVNYTTKASGLKNDYPRHPGTNDNRFFYSVPKLDNNQRLLAFQQAQVDRLLEISLPFPNVLYCMDNETNGAEEWGEYWAEYIHKRAADRGTAAYVTEMWDDWNLSANRHRRTFDHPDRYPFVDVSQNNHNKGQTHWDRLHWVRTYLAKQPRPVNCVKVYGSDAYRFGTDRDGVERFWRSIVAGCAAVRFHRPPAGLGLGEMPQASLRAVREIEGRVPWWTVEPRLDLLTDRNPNEAYLAADPGTGYVLYFPNGGSVKLDLTKQTGPFQLQWLDLSSAEWRSKTTIQGGNHAPITAPGRSHWAAVVWRGKRN